MSGGQTPLDKLKAVDWRGLVRTATNKVKQYAMNLSPLEIQVEEATNMDTWGPHGSVMSDICEACYDSEGYRQVLGVLARRLQEKDEHWRMCYKALLLLEFLIKQGPPKVADDVANSMSVLDKLQRFNYKDANGRDHGANVRHRAQEIAQLVNNPELLREEREKARANKAKYKGMSAAEMRSGGGGGYGSSGHHRGGFDRSTLARPGEGSNPRYSSSSISPSLHSKGFGSDSVGSRSQHVGGRGGGDSWGSSPRGGSSNVSTIDAVDATRARIEQFKLQERSAGGPAIAPYGPSEGEGGKKKLADVKVNPKIAASLGLKLAPPPTTKATTSSDALPAPFPEDEIDLLGGLDDDCGSAAPEQAHGNNGGTEWNAFGDGPVTADNTSFAPAEDCEHSKNFDPFSAAVSWPTAEGKLPKESPSSAASRSALPEDMFADLTGLHKPMQPMGAAGGARASVSGLAFSSGGASPLAAAAAATAAGPVELGFADFGRGEAATMSMSPSGTATVNKDPFAELLI